MHPRGRTANNNITIGFSGKYPDDSNAGHVPNLAQIFDQFWLCLAACCQPVSLPQQHHLETWGDFEADLLSDARSGTLESKPLEIPCKLVLHCSYLPLFGVFGNHKISNMLTHRRTSVRTGLGASQMTDNFGLESMRSSGAMYCREPELYTKMVLP